MNIVILVFVILSTVFVAASINNLRVCLKGVNEFFELADIADYTFLIFQPADYDATQEDIGSKFLDGKSYVDSYQTDMSLICTDGNFRKADKSEVHFNNSFFIISDECRHKLFDENDREITKVEGDDVYLPRGFLKENDIEVGDSIYIRLDSGFEKRFTVKGILKDAFFGSSMMGNKRVLISQENYEIFAEKEELGVCQTFSVCTSQLKELKQAINTNKEMNVLFGADRALLQVTYVMDTVIALVLLLVGICLIVIFAVMLRFTVVFTIKEAYKEIGIMKAIGLSETSIRKLYAAKYFVIAAAGAIIGFAISLPFSKTLLKSITQLIVLKKSDSGIQIALITAVVITIIVTLYAYHSTKGIRKMTPMDAIRSGNIGERFRRKNVVTMKKTKLSTTMFMAVSDVCSEWKKFLILLITSILCVWLAVMPVNTINTLRSEKMAGLFGMLESDYVISSDNLSLKLLSNGEQQPFLDYMDEMEKNIRSNGIDVERITAEIMLRYTARKGEDSCSTVINHGLNTKTTEYVYEEGVAPVLENEVAITHVVADAIDAKIGDTIYVKNGAEEKPYIVTGYFQSLNNQGEGLRFGQEETVDYQGIIGTFGFQVFLKEQPDPEEDERILEKLETLYPKADVMKMPEFVDGNIGGIAGQLKNLKYIVLAVVMLMNLLVVVLMQKMFVIREEGEVGMLKAIGFTDASIIRWQTKRITMVLLLGIVIGTATGTLFSQFTSGFVFKFMGASKITFVVNPLEVYCIYPLLIVAITILGCILATRKVKKLGVQSMNEME